MIITGNLPHPLDWYESQADLLSTEIAAAEQRGRQAVIDEWRDAVNWQRFADALVADHPVAAEIAAAEARGYQRAIDALRDRDTYWTWVLKRAGGYAESAIDYDDPAEYLAAAEHPPTPPTEGTAT